MNKSYLVRGWEIPRGWALVREEWIPVIEEVDRRADKMGGMENDFLVTIYSDEYQEIDAADHLQLPMKEDE